MPSLADISDSIFAVGEVIKDVGSGGILLYQNKYPGAVPTELEYYWADPYQGYLLIPAFRDISTPNEPYLERYVVGWPRIYKWTVNYTEAGKYLPDAIGTDAVFLRPDEVGVNTQRFLWGSADNGNFAVGYDYLDPNFQPALITLTFNLLHVSGENRSGLPNLPPLLFKVHLFHPDLRRPRHNKESVEAVALI